MKINELQEGVEYYVTFCGEKNHHKYKVENNKLIFYREIENIWMDSTKPYNEVIEAEFEPCKWMPKLHEKYYFPSFEHDESYSDHRWVNDSIDNRIKHNVGIYRTSKEAIVKAKELGWT